MREVCGQKNGQGEEEFTKRGGAGASCISRQDKTLDDGTSGRSIHWLRFSDPVHGTSKEPWQRVCCGAAGKEGGCGPRAGKGTGRYTAYREAGARHLDWQGHGRSIGCYKSTARGT